MSHHHEKQIYFDGFNEGYRQSIEHVKRIMTHHFMYCDHHCMRIKERIHTDLDLLIHDIGEKHHV